MMAAIKTAGVLRLGVMGFAFLYAPKSYRTSALARGSLLDLNELNEAMPERTMAAPEILNAMAGRRRTFFKFKDGQPNPVIALLRESFHARH